MVHNAASAEEGLSLLRAVLVAADARCVVLVPEMLWWRQESIEMDGCRYPTEAVRWVSWGRQMFRPHDDVLMENTAWERKIATVLENDSEQPRQLSGLRKVQPSVNGTETGSRDTRGSLETTDE